MKTIRINAHNLDYWAQQSRPNVVALGFFDGVHRGHKKVIQTARSIAKQTDLSLAVMSFFPHPKTILANNNTTFNYVMPLSKKASVLESLGVDTFYIVECNKEFLSLLPERFVSDYLLDLNVVRAVAGFDFAYGHKAAGSIDRLKSDSGNQIDVTKVDKIDFQGKKISSTWIRKLIATGDMVMLSNVLGRNYEIEMYWDGDCFRLAPYYMMPAPGTYKVTLSIKGRHCESEVFVSDDQKRIFIIDRSIGNFFTNERVNIQWVNKVPTTTKYTDRVYMF